MSKFSRVILSEEPFHLNRSLAPWDRGRLDAKFLTVPNSDQKPLFVVYQLEFSLTENKQGVIHVTGDERYELYLDDEFVGRGSERGDFDQWYFESFALELDAGKHRLTALVWSVGEAHSAYAQFSVTHGFLCIGEGLSMLTTGHADWKYQVLQGVTMIPRLATFGAGDRFKFNGSLFSLDALDGKGNWSPAIGKEIPTIPGVGDVDQLRVLRMATLPAQLSKTWDIYKIRHVELLESSETATVKVNQKNDLPDQHVHWQDFLLGKELIISAHTKIRAIVDLENYLCGYWHVETNGGKGATFRIHWQENLYAELKKAVKTNRDEIEGLYFGAVWHGKPGSGDTVLAGGKSAEKYHAPWWLSGRYIEIYVETLDEALTLSKFKIEETRFPIEPPHHPFQCNDEKLQEIAEICLRTLQMDSHETYMDCPYYEQLQYVGDTRVEALMTLALMDNPSLPRKAVSMFDASRGRYGFTQSRYPSRNRQFIPPFSLVWILMVGDQLVWRDDPEFVNQFRIGVKGVLDAHEILVQRDPNHAAFGLAKAAEFWNYLDWVPEWKFGIPPGGVDGYSIPLNLLLLLAIEQAVEFESLFGFAQSHRHYLLWAAELRAAIKRHLSPTGLLLDAVGESTVSEHAHALAALCNDAEIRVISEKYYEKPEGYRATYYFQHYRFEALAKLKKADVMLENIRQDWGKMIELGLKTTPEQPEPTRSDCHAWSAHPLYHFQTKILGITPLEANRFEFQPSLCDLEWADGFVSTGKGPIHVSIEKTALGWKATIVVPEGIIVSIPSVKGMISGPKTATIDPFG
jgi:alpha-L-rhamnosidase